MVAAVLVVSMLQIVWRIVVFAVGHRHPATVVPLAFGLGVAEHVVIAAAAIECGRRLGGARRTGMWIVAGLSVAAVIVLAIHQGIVYRARDVPAARAFVIAMIRYGWGTLEAAIVIGFAIAAGARGAWLAAPGILLAVLQTRPFLYDGSARLVAYTIANGVVLALMAAAADRAASAAPEHREHLRRGLKRAQVSASLAAVLAVSWLAPMAVTHAPEFSLASTAAHVAVDGLLIAAAWGIARSRMPGVPRWLWLVVIAGVCWEVARSVLLAFLLFTTPGGVAAATLGPPHWSAAVPGALAALAALAALVVHARRTHARTAERVAIAACALSALAFVAWAGAREQRYLIGFVYAAANVAALYAYRAARAPLDGGLPRARVV